MRYSNSVKKLRAISAALVMIALACALAFTGCSGAKATLSQSVDGDSAMATVTAVNGNTLTVRVMDGQPGEPPDGAGQGSGKDGGTDAGGTGQGAGKSDDAGSGQAPSGNPPEKPSGDNSSSGDNASGDSGNGNGGASGQAPSGNPPEKPEGDQGSQGSDQGGTPPSDGQGGPGGGTEMTLTINDESVIYTASDGAETQGSLSDIAEGSMLTLTVSDGSNVTKVVVGGAGGPGQASGAVNNGTGATTFSSDAGIKGKSYDSTSADENSVRVENGAAVKLTDATVTKSGDSTSSEDSDFYGLNAGVLAFDSSKLTLSGGTVTTKSSGSNGVFAYGEGTEANVSDVKIRTTKGNSGGIEVAGGATLTASNLDVDTKGESSAAIRSDRGGGTETVSGGSFATHGKNSPAVYSTADVTVSKAKLSAENTEAVVIEGKNSVTLEDCDVTGNVNGNATKSGVVNNVMIYQSMSGDASEGTGSFTMKGGTFTATHGTLFYVTNTDATIDLNGVDIDNAGDSLLTVAGNDGTWGSSGSNGGTVTFTATDQKLAGAITVDDSSSLALKLAGSTSYAGAINSDGAHGTVNVTLESGSTWKLTGDAYVSSLDGDTSGIDLNGHTLYVNGTAWSK